MYIYLLFFHSVFRWLVLISLLFALFRSLRGWLTRSVFSKFDDLVRHVTATISHIQLTIGYVLYFNSPLIAYFRSNYSEAVSQFDFKFFGMIHITLMTIAIFVITIGSSMAKRQAADHAKFKIMTLFLAAALLLIFVSIPWPFSPLANRPYLRSF